MIENVKSVKSPLVFCSYSSADRQRVSGLGLLMEALGYKVFLDHKTITPGVRWQASLQEGLDDADILVVYWTKNSSTSNWVRKEIEYFHTRYPERQLIPIVGDETPLSELLSVYQKCELFPLINELLDLKKRLEREGVKQKDIRNAILARLCEAGIDLDDNKRDQLLLFFAGSGLLGLIATPGTVLDSIYYRGVEIVSQLTVRQSAALIFAAGTGAVLCNLTDNPAIDNPTSTAGITLQSTVGTSLLQPTGVELSSIDLTVRDGVLGRWTAGINYDTNLDNTEEEIWFEIRRNCHEIYVETSASAASSNDVLLNGEVVDFSSNDDVQVYYLKPSIEFIAFRDAEWSQILVFNQPKLGAPYWGHYTSTEEKYRTIVAEFGESNVLSGFARSAEFVNLRQISTYEPVHCD